MQGTAPQSASNTTINPQANPVGAMRIAATAHPILRLQRLALWIGFVVIVVGGGLFASIGYRHGLPIVDLEDEKTIWSMGRAMMDSNWVMYQPQYPPGILIVSETVQRLQVALGDPWINSGVTIEVMRVMSVIAFTVALAILTLLAYRLGGVVAAIAAALFWMLLPLGNFQAKFSTVDCWLAAWFIAGVASAVEAWHRRSVRWLALSLLLALIATIFKYQAASALIIVALACLTFWPVNRRKTVALIVVYGVIVGAFSYWLIVIHQALSDNLYLPFEKTYRPTWAFFTRNLAVELGEVGPFLLFGALPILSLLLSALWPEMRRRLHYRFGYWMFPFVIVGFTIIVSFNGAPVFARHYLSLMTLTAVMAGVGLALIWQMVWRVAQRFQQPWLGRLVLAALVLVVASQLAPMIHDTLGSDLEMLRPDRRPMLAEWARTTAIDGPMLITDPLVAISVQPLYGYRGRTIDAPYNEGTFRSIGNGAVTSEVIAAKNIRYVIAGPTYNDAKVPLTRLFAPPTGEDFRGPRWGAYYVGKLPTFPPDQIVTFGGQVQLRGYSLSASEVCPSQAVDMRLLWGSANVPTLNYSFYVHLASDQSGERSAPINGGEPVSTSRQTPSWTEPSELLVGPMLKWSIPADLPLGTYHLWLGVYDPISGARLKLPNGADHTVLTSITVGPCRLTF